MPNWCSNLLRIKGHKNDIPKCIEFMGSKDKDGRTIPIDFNKIDPQPDNLLDAHKLREIIIQEDPTKSTVDYIHTLLRDDRCWRGWRMNHWGTTAKLNPYDCSEFEMNSAGTIAEIRFQTAWSPVSPLIKTLSSKFPDMEFELWFYEGGVGFAGIEFYRGGTLMEENQCEATEEKKSSALDVPMLYTYLDIECEVSGCEPEDLGYIYNEETQSWVWDEEYC